ncbi:Cytochrome P450 [Amycolatopsis arida]|uniref:Cytochrome P450 n=1 Tax=Amycolatopsis arida TaxID=587909 RepID=A0A1I5KTH9_9PSEU|nr:cytochrome P450 [Amycolatopsis arida]TDX85838.1 cytochrome P450 [Amycolatopsis arida]SFO88420.1 Cytochrome P450 [Amycolatopsis arida]
MTDILHEATLPIGAPDGRPLDPPDRLAWLREHRPVSRMRYPDGHVGWLVTGHAAVRAVLADRRFSTRLELAHNPYGSGEDAPLPPAQPGDFLHVDPPEHTRYRRLLTGEFTVRRMRQLADRVERFTAERLDAMERQGPPADLVPAFAQAVPALVICDLLGVPYADRERFHHHAVVVTGSIGTAEEQAASYLALQEYLAELVPAKRAEPTDDLLSGLTRTDLTDEELTNIGVLLLGAGLDTTANMLALGTFALLGRPERVAALRADPGLVEPAVEELLRYLSIVPATVRVALEDVEIAGETIAAGDTVTVSLTAANRDPERFPEPDTLVLSRAATGHAAFGHGLHQCLGQQLARVELRIAFPALLSRFPTLRLAVPSEAVRFRSDALIHGVHALPVTWDT